MPRKGKDKSETPVEASSNGAADHGVAYPEGFSGPLLPSINSSTLVTKLRDLVKRLEQEYEADPPTHYFPLSKHLSNSSFLDTSSAEVRVHLACALVQLYRINQKEWPKSNGCTAWQDIQIFLARALSGLRAKDGPEYTNHHALLESVTVNRIFESVGDAAEKDGSSSVLTTLIKTLSAVLEKKKAIDRLRPETTEEETTQATTTENLIKLVIETFSENTDAIDHDVIDELLFRITAPEKVNNPEACRVILRIIGEHRCSIGEMIKEALVHSICFSVDASLGDTFKKTGGRRAVALELVIELFDHLPEVIAEVLPRMTDRLQNESSDIRMATVRTIFTLMKTRDCLLYEQCPGLWKVFLTRCRDKDVDVRALMAENMKELILRYRDIRGVLWEMMENMVTDGSEKVRILAIEAAINTARNNLEAVSEHLLDQCCERMRDKKLNIRTDTMKNFLNLCKEIMENPNSTNSDHDSAVNIAKRVLLAVRDPGTSEEKLIAEKGLINAILPMKMETTARMKAFIHFYHRLDPMACKVVTSFLDRTSARRRLLAELLSSVAHARDGAEAGKEKLEATMLRLAKFIPGPEKASFATLQLLCNMLSQENSQFQLLSSLLPVAMTREKAIKLVTTFIEGMERFFDKKGVRKEQISLIRGLITLSAPLLIDSDSFMALIRLTHQQTKDALMGETTRAARMMKKTLGLVNHIANLYPGLLENDTVIDTLIDMSTNEDDEIAKSSVLAIESLLKKAGMRANLQAASQGGQDVAAAAAEGMRSFRWFPRIKTALLNLLHDGTPGAAKHSIIALGLLLGREAAYLEAKQIIDFSLNSLDGYDETTTRKLYILKQAARTWSTNEEVKGRLCQLAVDKTLHRLINVSQADREGRDEPTEEEMERGIAAVSAAQSVDELPLAITTRNRVAAIKLLVRILLLVAAKNTSEDIRQICRATMSMLTEIVEKGGRVSDHTRPEECAYLLPTAAAALVRLAMRRFYSRDFTMMEMRALLKVARDESEMIRLHFFQRLFKYYHSMGAPPGGEGLPTYFLALLPLSVMRPLNIGAHYEISDKLRAVVRKLVTTAAAGRVPYIRAHHAKGIKMQDCAYLQPEYVLAFVITFIAEDDDWRSCEYRPNMDSESRATLNEQYLAAIDCLQFTVECLYPPAASGSGGPGPAASAQGGVVPPLDWELVRASLQLIKTQGVVRDEERREEKEARRKKLWALSDVAAHILFFRAKIESHSEPREATLPKQFFEGVGNKQQLTVHAPPTVLAFVEGKGVAEFKKGGAASLDKSRNTSTIKKSVARSGGRGRGKKAPLRAIEEDDEEEEDEETEPAPKKTRRVKESAKPASQGRTRANPPRGRKASTRSPSLDLDPILDEEVEEPVPKKTRSVKEPAKPASHGRTRANPSRGRKASTRSPSTDLDPILDEDEEEKEEEEPVPKSSRGQVTAGNARKTQKARSRSPSPDLDPILDEEEEEEGPGPSTLAATPAAPNIRPISKRISSLNGNLRQLGISPITGPQQTHGVGLTSSTPIGTVPLMKRIGRRAGEEAAATVTKAETGTEEPSSTRLPSPGGKKRLLATTTNGSTNGTKKTKAADNAVPHASPVKRTSSGRVVRPSVRVASVEAEEKSASGSPTKGRGKGNNAKKNQEAGNIDEKEEPQEEEPQAKRIRPARAASSRTRK